MSITKAVNVYQLLQQFEGEKVITVSTGSVSKQFFMMDERVENEVSFFSAVSVGLKMGGSLVLRHINGENEDIYGAVLRSGDFLPIPKETMEEAHTTDHKTGKHIPKEENVRYCAFKTSGI